MTIITAKRINLLRFIKCHEIITSDTAIIWRRKFMLIKNIKRLTYRMVESHGISEWR